MTNRQRALSGKISFSSQHSYERVYILRRNSFLGFSYFTGNLSPEGGFIFSEEMEGGGRWESAQDANFVKWVFSLQNCRIVERLEIPVLRSLGMNTAYYSHEMPYDATNTPESPNNKGNTWDRKGEGEEAPVEE